MRSHKKNDRKSIIAHGGQLIKPDILDINNPIVHDPHQLNGNLTASDDL